MFNSIYSQILIEISLRNSFIFTIRITDDTTKEEISFSTFPIYYIKFNFISLDEIQLNMNLYRPVIIIKNCTNEKKNNET